MSKEMYTCKFCGGKPKSYGNFKKHINMKKHLIKAGKFEEGKTISNHKCEDCNKVFCNEQSFRSHKMTDAHNKKVEAKKAPVVIVEKKRVGRPKKVKESIIAQGGVLVGGDENVIPVEVVKRKPGRPRRPAPEVVVEKKEVGRPCVIKFLDSEFLSAIQ